MNLRRKHNIIVLNSQVHLHKLVCKLDCFMVNKICLVYVLYTNIDQNYGIITWTKALQNRC